MGSICLVDPRSSPGFPQRSCPRLCQEHIFFLISGFLLHRLLSKSLLKKLESQEYLDKVEQVESEVEGLARQFVGQMDMQFPPADDEA